MSGTNQKTLAELRLGTIEVFCYCGESLFKCSTNVHGITQDLTCKCGAVARFNHSLIPLWDAPILLEASHAKNSVGIQDQREFPLRQSPLDPKIS